MIIIRHLCLTNRLRFSIKMTLTTYGSLYLRIYLFRLFTSYSKERTKINHRLTKIDKSFTSVIGYKKKKYSHLLRRNPSITSFNTNIKKLMFLGYLLKNTFDSRIKHSSNNITKYKSKKPHDIRNVFKPKSSKNC